MGSVVPKLWRLGLAVEDEAQDCCPAETWQRGSRQLGSAPGVYPRSQLEGEMPRVQGSKVGAQWLQALRSGVQMRDEDGYKTL